MFIYDSVKAQEDNHNIRELDYSNDFARARFDQEYGFHADSLMDIPVECGVRPFVGPAGQLVFASDDPIALAMTVAGYEEEMEENQAP